MRVVSVVSKVQREFPYSSVDEGFRILSICYDPLNMFRIYFLICYNITLWYSIYTYGLNAKLSLGRLWISTADIFFDEALNIVASSSVSNVLIWVSAINFLHGCILCLIIFTCGIY